LIRSSAFAHDAIQQIERMLTRGSYRVTLEGDRLLWEAPPGAPFRSTHSEPDASAKLKLMLHLIAPFAPEEML
jgi:cardiolipin synthase C